MAKRNLLKHFAGHPFELADLICFDAPLQRICPEQKIWSLSNYFDNNGHA
jgi:hypothetical protein